MCVVKKLSVPSLDSTKREPPRHIFIFEALFNKPDVKC